ncbi:leucyl aminopeptidase [Rhabdaerophilum calidifontis]|uniref:leucyl aminopeptidase n=1 Tax=Rhabdaerophilum calidifontis TaxID=2604328 RepID=UPI00123C27D9|nr:leucyl aminopeptidase [Rhabdaerophilum calidifontis]
MPAPLKITFAGPDEALAPVVVVFLGKDGALGAESAARLGRGVAARIKAAAAAESFAGKAGQMLALPAEPGLGERPAHLLLVGTAEGEAAKPRDFVRIGGQIHARLPKGRVVSLLANLPERPLNGGEAADLALGLRLAAYRFDRYQTKKKEEDSEDGPASIQILSSVAAAARKESKTREAAFSGVELARDLVNEPPNVLTPVEFARRAAALEKLGVEIDVLDEKALKKLGMRALLGVGQGSEQESRVVILKWLGARDEKAPPAAFIGKGVVFDTGGISIKPAQGMEDMKGDMAGAAAVVGLMQTLALRKAKANVIGVIGLVENMPDGNAQRPGDIVTSMSGQTIEIINTDAEGRLVLADLLWHVKHRFNPKFMVDLATLTGAIIVALGQEHAGLFSNDDDLAARLLKAGQETGEKLWRMPLGPEYDKQIDSKFADVKNSGGRNGGAITAAQFLQRFVDGCPWAHLDIAGTAMGSPQTEINRGWASGFGVRLLDRLVALHCEG